MLLSMGIIKPVELQRCKLSVGLGGLEKAAVVWAWIDAPVVPYHPFLCALLGCFLASPFFALPSGFLNLRLLNTALSCVYVRGEYFST